MRQKKKIVGPRPPFIKFGPSPIITRTPGFGPKKK